MKHHPSLVEVEPDDGISVGPAVSKDAELIEARSGIVLEHPVPDQQRHLHAREVGVLSSGAGEPGPQGIEGSFVQCGLRHDDAVEVATTGDERRVERRAVHVDPDEVGGE